MANSSIQKTDRKHRAQRLYRQATKLEKKGFPEHLDEAVTLLRDATRLGSKVAALKLAELYLNEDYPDLYNPESAMKLLKRLADRGNASAAYMLSQQLLRNGVNEEAVKYLSSASNKEYPPAMALLGEKRLKGDGVEKNTQLGVRLLSHAAQAGNVKAQMTLSTAYHLGEHLPEKPDRALFYARQAALQTDKLAQMRLGVYYATGYGVDRDPRESYFWMYQAAKQGFAYAQAVVGECLQEGFGVRRNKKKGTKFYVKAAAQGDQFAEVRLGLCYILGRGTKQDKEKGVSLLREAAENGNEYAPIYLVMFGRLKYIPVEEAEIKRYEKKIEEAGHAISLSEEPVPIIKRKKNWVHAEYDHIEFFHYLDEEYASEDDEPIPGPFDPLLNLGRRIIAPLTKIGTKE
ncbi:MAG: sel1 repeat family protein [Firmicutes bacterium]|nr:sel1 repeat family protein [Bacillota bacterium]